MRTESTSNYLSKTLQEALRKRTFGFSRSEAYLTRIKQQDQPETNEERPDPTDGDKLSSGDMSESVAIKERVPRATVSEDNGVAAEVRPAEKKKVLLMYNVV